MLDFGLPASDLHTWAGGAPDPAAVTDSFTLTIIRFLANCFLRPLALGLESMFCMIYSPRVRERQPNQGSHGDWKMKMHYKASQMQWKSHDMGQKSWMMEFF